jgi:hypothetical protein
VEWQRHSKASPGECASSPSRRWSRASAASQDWSRREHRRACLQLVRHQRIEVSLPPSVAASPRTADVILTRSQRTHTRLAWTERLARPCAPRKCWPGDDPPVWRDIRLHHLVREGSGLNWASVPLEYRSLRCDNEADRRGSVMSSSKRRSPGWNTQNRKPC